MNPSLTISFNPDAVEPVVRIKIDQKKWHPYTGYVTKIDVAKFIANAVLGIGDDEPYETTNRCTDNEMIADIYAYPYEVDLNYTMFSSYGTLSERIQETITKKDIISVSLDNTVSLEYPAQQIFGLEWEGVVYDFEGAEVSTDNFTWLFIAPDKIKFNKKVYGSLKVFYEVERHTYSLTVVMREDAIENKFSSVVYAVYYDGLVYHKVEVPEGAEESEGGSLYNCGYGSTTITTEPPSPLAPPISVEADRTINKDYCTQEVITDSTFERTNY